MLWMGVNGVATVVSNRSIHFTFHMLMKAC